MDSVTKADRREWIKLRVALKAHRRATECCTDCGRPSHHFRCDKCMDRQSIARAELEFRKANGWYWRGKWRLS